MATLTEDSFLKGISGTLGKQLVFKNYSGKTVITLYPDMTNIKPSRKQKHKRNIFKEAVAYAKRINNNPVLKQQYIQKISGNQSVYHYAIKEYLQNRKTEYSCLIKQYFILQ